MISLHSQVCKYVICIVQYVRDKLKVNKTYAFLPFLSFPRRRESSIWPFFNALDSRSDLKYVICIVQYVRDKLKVNKTYAFLPFLSFPRRRESSIWPFFNALDSRSPPSRGQASRE